MAWKPVYATTPQMKEWTRIPFTDVVDDVVLATKLETASRNVDKATGRQFGRVGAVVERFYPIRYDRRKCRYWAVIDDLMTTDDLVVKIDGTVVASGYTLEERNAAADGKPWEFIILPRGGTEVAITAWWGWTTVPKGIQEATMLEANRLLGRRNSPFGVAGSPDQGSEIRLLAKLDVDAAKSAGPYVRWWAAA